MSVLVASSILTLATISQPVADRTATFSAEYRSCEQRSDANVDSGFCLSDELERQRIQMRQGLREAKRYASPEAAENLDQSQSLWQQSVDLDCKSEFEMGGSAAPMRALACEIGLTIARTNYLNIRGSW